MSDEDQFDVFLCHNSEDKEAVIKIAHLLESHKIRPWLDIWYLRPGSSWQKLLEQQINQIGGVAIFVGSSGLGPWQSKEIRAFLQIFVNREKECPIIPILLPDAPIKPELPIFLQDYTWIDFRLSQPDPMAQLIWGITGKSPEQKPKLQPVIQADDLSSEKGVNYTQLRDLLAAGKWKEADEETLAIMLKASSREKKGWFDTESINNFPCTDLRTIDQLWVKYSDGRFGFSVQKKIYLSVGGKADGEYYQEAWYKFGDRVGWRVKGRWIGYEDVAFKTSVHNKTSAHEGHLPLPFLMRFRLEFVGWREKNGCLSLFSRRDL